MIRSSATANTIITDTGVYLSGTVFYTDAVASIGNSSIRSANVTTDNIILKNSLRLGNTYLSTSRANTNQIYAINSALVGDSQANTYLTRDGLQIFRADTPPVTPGAGFTNANMTYNTLTIKNINANTINARTLNISGSATEFPGNTHFLGQNNYFRFGLTSNANIELINGRIKIGTTNTPSNKDTATPKLVVSGSGVAGAMQVVRHTSVGGGGGILELSSTRGTDVNSYTILQSGDGIGALIFAGADGSEFVQAASIVAQVDGTPGDDDMPGRLIFSTTADGASSTTERMRIDSSGNVGIGGTPANGMLELFKASGEAVLRINSTAASSWVTFNPSSAAYLHNVTATPMIFTTNATERMRIDSSGNVGLGTTAPSQKLHVAGGALITGAATVSGALTAGAALAVAGAATVGGSLAVTGTTTVTGATTLNSTLTVNGASTHNGQGDFTALQNVGTLRTSTHSLGGIEVRSASNNDAAFMTFHKPGNYASYFGLDTDNYFAVGGWSAGGALANFKCNIFSASGAITAGGNITAFFSSDERLKENVVNISNPLEKLALLNGVTFDWKDSYIESQGGLDAMFVRKNDVGIIAQDLEKVLPQLVAERSDGYKAVKYDRIVALLIEAVKELKAEVDSLKNGN
jgi:hypothetical protein